jgi:hypothetical protein
MIRSYDQNLRIGPKASLSPVSPSPYAPFEPDPYFSNVTLLLPLTNGDVTNYGSTGGTMATGSGGSTGFSMAQSKFGQGSYYVDGANGYGTIAQNANAYGMVSQSFTIELWVYPVSHTSYGGFIAQASNPPGGYGYGWQFLFYINTMYPWVTLGTNTLSNLSAHQSNTVITNGAWHHLAITRNASNRFSIWVNGVETHNATVTNTNIYLPDSYNLPMKIGASREENRYQQHYINDVRITQGVCRYTGTFTPPTTRFPTS